MPARPLSLALIVMGAVAFILFVAVLAPRSLAIAPPLIGILIYSLWPFFGQGSRPALKNTASVLAFGVVALSALSAFWALNPGESLERAFKLMVVLVPGALFFTVCAATPVTEKDSKCLWFWLPALFIAACLFMMSEYMTDYFVYRLIRGIPADEGVAIAVMNRSSVILSMVFLPVLALVWVGASTHLQGALQKIFPCLVVISLLFLLFFTESQSSQMAVLLGLSVFLLFPVENKWAMRGLFVLICAGILGAPFLCRTVFEIFTPLYDAGSDYGWVQRANIMPRLEVWNSVSTYILTHPFLGSGIEATRSVPAFETQEIFQPGRTLLHPHNAVLQIWMEFGVVGAMMSCILFGLLLRSIHRMAANPAGKATARLALGLLAAVGGVGVVGYGLWQGWWLGLLILCAGMAVFCIHIIQILQNR